MDVVTAVLRHSTAEYADRLVMVVLADDATHDGVTYLGQDKIAARARVTDREVRNVIRGRVAAGELEVRKAQRGRRRINVYRVIVGDIGLREIEYERLPFALNEPFTRPEDISGRHLGTAGSEVPVEEPVTTGTTTGTPIRARASLPRSTSPSGSPDGDPAVADVEQQVREVWAAVEDVLGYAAPTIASRRRDFAKLVRTLVVEADATADEVRRRAASYRAHPTLGGTMLTLPALAKWWHAFEPGTRPDLLAGIEAHVRRVAPHVTDDYLVQELRDEVRRGRITADVADELLVLGREVRAEWEAHQTPEAAEFGDVRASIDDSLEEGTCAA